MQWKSIYSRSITKTKAFDNVKKVALHNKSRGQRRNLETCEDCLKKHEGCLGDENFQFKGGCRQHPSTPLLWRCGNPMTSTAVEDRVQELFSDSTVLISLEEIRL
jgi:hypothetical protein